MKLLPIAGKNENGSATGFALNNNGEVKTQHQWKTEEVTVLNATSITSTGAFWSDRIDVSKYAIYSLRITNSHDQPITVIFARDTGNNNTTYLKNYGGANLGFTIPASSGCRMITPEQFPFFQYLQNFKIRYECSVAPTTGSLSIIIVGKY